MSITEGAGEVNIKIKQTNLEPDGDHASLQQAGPETQAVAWHGAAAPAEALRACVNDDRAAVVAWLDSGGDVDAGMVESKCTMLQVAAALGQARVVELLLARSAGIEWGDGVGETALIVACGQGRGRVVELLLSSGARVDVANKQGCTALMAAACQGHT